MLGRWLRVAAPSVVAACAAAVVLAVSRDRVAQGVREVERQWTPGRIVDVAVALLVVGAAVSLPPLDRLLAPAVERVGRRVRQAVAAALSIPPAISLPVIVALAVVVSGSLVASTNGPDVLGDELLYVDLAKSIAVHGAPLVRGDLDIGQSLLYPLFLSPAYALARDGAVAGEVARLLNAVAMSLAAVPAYLLARRVVSSPWAVAVAALSVAAPWLAYTRFILTESLFYPSFVLFALLFTRMLERPTLRRQLLVAGGLAVLIGIRPQALALAGSIVLAVLLFGFLADDVAGALRTFRPVLALLVAAGLVTGAVAGAGVPIPAGAYTPVFTGRLPVVDLLAWTARNLAVYELALGVVALLAFPLALAGLIRRGGALAERAFGVTSLTLALGILASVSVLSASPYGLGILHERNLFYVTPLVLACVARWLASGLPRSRWAVLAVGAAGIAAAVATPGRVLRSTNDVDSPTTAFVRAFDTVSSRVSAREWLILAVCAGTATLLVARRPLFPLAALVLCLGGVTAASLGEGPLTVAQARELAWVDHSLPRGQTATLVHVDLQRPNLPCAEVAEYAQQGLAVWTEFLNTRVDRLVHVYGTRGRDNLSAPLLTVGQGGEVVANGRPLRAAYVVVDSRQPLVGQPVARFDLDRAIGDGEGASLTLWHVAPPLRLGSVPQPLPPRGDGSGC